MPSATTGQAIPIPEPGSFLAMLSDSERDALIARGSVEHRGAGKTIFREGEDGTSVLVLLSGRVRAISADGSGTMTTLGPGSLFGELSAICGKPRSATVLALEDARLLALPAQEYTAFLEADSKIANALLRRYIERSHMIDGLRGS